MVEKINIRRQLLQFPAKLVELPLYRNDKMSLKTPVVYLHRDPDYHQHLVG